MISPFSPIFFPSGKSDGIESRCIQTFAKTDRIVIQYFGDEVSISLLDADTMEAIAILQSQSWPIGNTTLRFVELCGLSCGSYRIRFGSAVSYPFVVTDDADVLDDTVLFQYAMEDNTKRVDAVFSINGIRHFFDFRVPGGFKDSEVTFTVDDESFQGSDGDVSNLYSLASTQRKFTLGAQEGVPVRFAEMLNRILTCTYVYIDGVRYCRVGGSAPEVNVQLEGLDSFVYKVNLQRVEHLNPVIEIANHVQIRLYQSDQYRSINESINRIIL